MTDNYQHKSQELRGCAPSETQLATFDHENATAGATHAQPHGLKALASKVLSRNSERNPGATDGKNQRNSGATDGKNQRNSCNTVATMTVEDERLIMDWLKRIDEQDQETIEAVLERCRTNSEALEFFLSQAKSYGRGVYEIPDTLQL